ncbi:hypothetical protein OIU76_025722 [Salix suchowensis]|nr:hypothetical protein OIU76_025722 [Salix suchowensis]
MKKTRRRIMRFVHEKPKRVVIFTDKIQLWIKQAKWP